MSIQNVCKWTAPSDEGGDRYEASAHNGEAASIQAISVRDTPTGPDEPPAFDPKPVRGDASLDRLLGHQRQLRAEHHQSLALDAGDAQLLPLMLSLARVSARAQVLGLAVGSPQ